MTVRALAGLLRSTPPSPSPGSRSSGRSAASHLERRRCGSPGSATSWVSRRSGSSGRSCSSSASRSAASGSSISLVRSGSPASVAGRSAGWPCRGRLGRAPTAPLVLVSAAGIALAGLLPRGAVPLGAPAEPPGVRRVGVLGAEGEGDLLLRRPRRAGLHDRAGPSYPPLAADPRRGGVPRDGERRHRHTPRPVLVPPRRRVAAVAGCLYRHAPAWLLWPSLLLVLVVPRFGERLLTPQADVLVDIFFVVAALLVALWLRDRRGWRLAAAAVLLGGAALRSARGSCSRRAVLVARVRLVARRRRAWPRLARRVRSSSSLAVVPWRLWYARDGIGGEARRRSPAWRPVVAWTRSTCRSTCSIERALVGRPDRRHDRAGRRRGLGRPPARRVPRLVLGLLFSAAPGRRSATRSCPITADESVNPIVRYTGAIVLLAGCATPLLLARCGAAARSEP